jgi:hypothetical protein
VRVALGVTRSRRLLRETALLGAVTLLGAALLALALRPLLLLAP